MKNVIALMGKSKSGKDTAGAMLTAHDPRGATIAFADKLKEVCMDLFGLSLKDVYTDAGKAQPLDGKAHALRLPCWTCMACGSLDCAKVAASQIVCHACTMVGEPQAFQAFWTPRTILQYLGTEGVRFIDENVWVRHALAKAKMLLNDFTPGELQGFKTVPARSFVAITDCRFRSEAEAIWKAGGQVWRIRRPATDRAAQGIAGHASETEMDTIPDSQFQWVITNDGTLDNFRTKVIEGYTRMFPQA